MSKNLPDFIDPYFWDWYRDKGPSWLIDGRMDILVQMYEAYEDSLPDKTVTMAPGQPFFFMGTNEELDDFAKAIQSILEPFKNPPKKKSKTPPITSKDIFDLHQALNTIKLKRRKTNEDNKS